MAPFSNSFVAVLGVAGRAILMFVGAAVLLLITSLIRTRRSFHRSPRPQNGRRFWTFYGINDRLYRNADRKRLNWSQERFRHHRFRWQSGP